MLIKVETVVGKKLEITTLEGHQTVLNIKEQIEMTENLPVAMQKLIFNGRPLVDTNTIEASGITAGTTIHMVLALRAGF